MQERANDVNNVAPSSLSHIIGQRSVVDQVRVALDAAFEDQSENGFGLARRPSRLWQVGPGSCDRRRNGNRAS